MGNKNTKNFEYDDFLKLTKQIHKQESASQQLVLQQYKCMMVHHKGKSIEGICMNETCKQQNRRTCFDCTNDRIHDKDHGKTALIKNADQSENMIQEFKSLINQQMDACQFQFYFEQLEFCDEIDDTVAYIKFQELIKIEEKIQSIQQKLNKLNFKLYLQEQYQNNVGLFQYLQDYQMLINIIYSQLDGYTQKKNQIKKQPEKFLQQHQVDQKSLKELQKIRKNKMSIIDIILKTNEFKNNKITNYQRLYLIKNIEDINKTMDQQNKEILATNYMILFQLDPKDANYYFNQGLLLMGNEKYAEAIIMFNQATKLDQQDPNYYYYKASALEKMEKYEQAILVYDQAIQIFPIQEMFYSSKAQILEKMENYQQAILVYDQAIQLDPKNQWHYCSKAYALEKMGKYEQAILVYDQAIQIDPKQIFFILVKLLQWKKWENMNKLYQQMIKLNNFVQQVQIILQLFYRKILMIVLIES